VDIRHGSRAPTMKPSPHLAAALLASILAGGLVPEAELVHATETRYEITRWLSGDYDLSYADPRLDHGERSIPIGINGGLTAESADGLSAACRASFLDDQPGKRDSSVSARGYVVMELLVKYRWWHVGASLFTPGDPFGVGVGFELSF